MSTYLNNCAVVNLEASNISWSIENIGSILTEHFCSLRSSVLPLQRSATLWYIQLELYKIKNDKVSVSVQLWRHFVSGGPEIVAVTFCLILSTEYGVTLWNSQNLSANFQKGGNYGITFVTSTAQLGNLPKNCLHNDVLVINCEMINICEHNSTIYGLDLDMEELSSDLMRLLRKPNTFNAVIVALDEEIGVHKEILMSRSEEFKKMFSTRSRINIPYSGQIVRLMLKIVYSENANIFIKDYPPPLELFWLALQYEIRPLKQIFRHTKEILMTTKIEPQTFSYSFIIPKFMEVFETINVNETHGYVTGSYYLAFNIKLFFNRVNGYRRLIFRAKPLNLSIVDCITSQISLVDNLDNEFFTLSSKWFYNPVEGICNFDFLITEDNIFSRAQALSLNTLKIIFLCKWKARGELTMSHGSIEKEDTTNYSYAACTLPDYMNSLLNENICADVKLMVSGRRIGAHISVLSIRAPVLLEHISNGEIIIPDRFTVSTIKRLLNYIYTACLPFKNPLDLIEIHDLADFYSIAGLREKCCALLLESKLSVKYVCDICLWSDRFNHLEKKTKCIKFIAENMDIILDKPKWLKLKEQNEDLCNDILRQTKHSNVG